ncbi:MAG: tetratricopeptide repeat protein [Chitinophagaceae bacterium]
MVKILLFSFNILLVIGINAQPYHNDSLDLAIKNAGDEGNKARMLLQRSRQLIALEPQKAFTDAQEALGLYLKMKAEEGQVDAYNMLSSIFSRDTKVVQAMQMDSTAITLADKINYQRGKAIGLGQLGRNNDILGNLAAAKEYFTESLEIIRKNNLHADLSDALNRMAIIHQKTGEYSQSLVYNDEGISIAGASKNQPQLSLLLMNRANTLVKLGRYDEAVDNHLQSIRIKENGKDYRGLLQSYTNLATLYNQTGEYNLAMEYYQKAMTLSKQYKYVQSQALILNNIGNLYARQKKFDSAVSLYRQAIPLYAQLNDLPGQGMVRNNIGNMLSDKGIYDSALTELKAALEIRQKLGSQNDIAATLNNMGRAAGKIKKYKEAEQYLLQSLNLAYKGDVKLNQYIRHNLGEYYTATGNMDQANKYMSQYISVRDTMMTEDEALSMLKKQSSYEIESRDTKLALASQEKEIQDLTIKEQRYKSWALTAGLLLAVVFSGLLLVSYLRKKKMAEVLMQKNKKIVTLIRELHHRVKNNMQLMSSVLGVQAFKLSDEEGKLAVLESQRRVEAMGLIHQDLYLHDEINSINIETYMQRLAHAVASSFGHGPDAVRTNIRMDNPMLDVDKALPLGLAANELLLNAFKHGAANAGDPEVHVAIHRKGKLLTVQVKDNGEGLSPSFDITNAGRTSFGMKLVQLMCQQINASLTWKNDGGACFNIELQDTA